MATLSKEARSHIHIASQIRTIANAIGENVPTGAQRAALEKLSEKRELLSARRSKRNRIARAA